MKTIVIMNNINTFFNVLAWFTCIILLVAVTATGVVALLCIFTLAFVKIFEGPGSLARAASSIVEITLSEVHGFEGRVMLSTPTLF